ncbi:MAG: ribokinase [Spirochaetaceae bacterium]|nr:MAG: ribokinase [Spirochaetaceae bacterium]
MDLVVNVERFPRPGESLVGTRFATHTGGKGANQAVALARLGARVRMIGRVGEDPFGVEYRDVLRRASIDDSGVESVAGTSTGVAVIEVDSSGENHIVYVPGANGTVDKACIDSNRPLIVQSEFALLQLEIPIETTEYALRTARDCRCATILDPAPAQKLAPSLIGLVDYLTPNAGEAELLTGIAVTDTAGARAAAEALQQQGAGTVIIKAGSLGSFVLRGGDFDHVPAFSVDAVDTTAAGDAFNAGLAVALGRGDSMTAALRYANAVGALSCRAAGAQSAMPTAAAVQHFITQQQRQ